MSEYGVKTALVPLPYAFMKWVSGASAVSSASLGSNVRIFQDSLGNDVIVSTSEWQLDFILRQNSSLRFFDSLADLTAAKESAPKGR